LGLLLLLLQQPLMIVYLLRLLRFPFSGLMLLQRLLSSVEQLSQLQRQALLAPVGCWRHA
jgi:hypothetical protein